MFSLPFKLRRKSETDHHSQSRRSSVQDPVLPLDRISSGQSTGSGRARSQSFGGKALSRQLSNTLSKRLSFFSNNSSDDLNSVVSSQSEFNTQELTRFKSLNRDRFPKEILQYLKYQGLSAPEIVQESSSVRISVSGAGENVFLPSLISISEEEQQNLELNSPNPVHDTNRPTSSDAQPTDSSTSENTSELLTHETQPVQTQTHMDDSVDPVSHTFAVIITLQKPVAITTIKSQLQATCSIAWPKGLPSDRNIKQENFELGQANWELNLVNYNFFIPISYDAVVDDDEDWDYDNSDSDIDTSRFATEQKIPTRKVELRSLDQVTRGGYSHQKREHDPFVFGAVNGNSNSVNYPPGHYVFLLPTLFEPSLPETVLTTKSHVSYNLRTIVAQKSKSYNYGEHYVPVIRAPPVSGVTTADKPIFVSKIWNDTLSYEISFPKKYVTLGSELPFKLKFVPLEKKVTIKRVKVNVVEKVTYVSKNLEFEYDEGYDDKDDSAVQSNGNEKIVPLLEVRTRARNSKAAREEVVEDAAVYDNLLSCCYNSENTKGDNTEAEVVGPLSINTYLPFIKPSKSAKVYPHTTKQFLPTVVNTERSKPQASKSLPTRISNQNYNVNTITKINHPEEGLIPDSLNNRYVKIEHKLQVCVRISRNNPDDNKVHHYEVIIDTPIYILNGCCVPESVELPAYTDDTAPRYFSPTADHLPTFEEVQMSPLTSPTLLPTHEETLDRLSRTSTLNTTAFDTNFDNIDTLLTDTSEFSLTSQRRRSTSVRAEMLTSFRRTTSIPQHPEEEISETGDIRVDSSSEEGDTRTTVMPDQPPPYVETIPLMSDESDSADEETSDHEMFVNDQCTDLTEEFHRAVYGDSI
ncbi:CYFA0S13e02608g1_1 [Cyberlindnera fabianii]|uniref:CYFA0S13e02608g1_1 n=1 Tax=Cyberlindnera fabianii TaxID=36022 RepID=A0A061B2P6_CYBFA|nr:CYFA0S13e02608g1_1 [Cyberlindnera fabianii]